MRTHGRAAVPVAAGIVAAALLTFATAAAADLAAVAGEVARATVLVEATTRNGSRTGSGFFLERSDLVATALHTIEGARSIKISIPGRYAASEARLLAASSSWDLAILSACWPAGAPRPGLALDTGGTLPPGTEVAITGFGLLDGALPQTPLTIRGIVSGWIEQRGAGAYVLDVDARAGLSGSPVYRTDTGAVAALLTRVHAAGSGVGPGGAAPAAALAEMLAGIGDLPAPPRIRAAVP
jgi:hypothetical protein